MLPLETVSALLRHAKSLDPFVIDASKWFAEHPSRPAALFIANNGVSERHARRRFHEHVGYGPKTLQRILRMQRVLWLLSLPDSPHSLAQLSIASGYADQAHLTREMRALTGQLPTTLAGNNPRSAVADLFKTSLP
jgi:transcriptional regulator GlxA family with amidase domain